MKYVLLVHLPPEVPEVDVEAEMRAYAELKEQLRAEGVWLGGQALHPPEVGTAVRVRDREALVVDTPFVETSEYLAGYYLLDCRDVDEAMAIARRVPGARHGTVEVRPVLEYERMLAEDT